MNKSDRSITLVMRKGHDLARINREVEPGDKHFTWVRHAAYRMVLGGYKAVDAMRTTVQYPAWLSGRALELFRGSIVITSRDVEGLFGISQRTARNILSTWVRSGFVVIADPAKKTRSYRLSPEYEEFGPS